MHTYHVIMIKETFAFKTDMRIMELEMGIEMTSDFDDQCALALIWRVASPHAEFSHILFIYDKTLELYLH